jgi:hypothetical protein
MNIRRVTYKRKDAENNVINFLMNYFNKIYVSNDIIIEIFI